MNERHTVIVTAPGLHFAMTPRDEADMRVVRAALRDAERRTRKTMRPCLPAPTKGGQS